MYLAKEQKSGSLIYQLRHSLKNVKGQFTSSLVYDLGSDPTAHFEVFEEHIIIFNTDLLAAVSPYSDNREEVLLEKLLWQFLPAETRRRAQPFQRRGDMRPGPLTGEEREAIAREVHLFDRRRLFYLRYGAVDQSRLTKLHEKCCRPLLGQSRDEREHYFAAEETVLEPGKYLQYVYAIFNLQQHFCQSFAPWFPEALAWDEIAEQLVGAACTLNSSSTFWQNEDLPVNLHPHLVRYLIMFFDHAHAPRSFLQDFSRSFMADHRRFRWPDQHPLQTPERILELFGNSLATLQQMSKTELTRTYRRKAMQLHPDLGGDHELFIELTEVFNKLLLHKE